eukprot:12928628-Prorocentrum_lima.AAC.1
MGGDIAFRCFFPTRTWGVQTPRVLMTSVPVLPCRRGQLHALPVFLLVPGSGTDVGYPHRRHRLLYACHWGDVVQLAPTV